MRNIVHTLCFNLVSQVELAVADLYRRNNNSDFIHVLVDVGYPLLDGDKLPNDIAQAKAHNSMMLQETAKRYGSMYLKIENQGVSQNWTQVAHALKIDDGDALICCDPDERVRTDGWVKALGDVIRAQPLYGWVSLIMPEHFKAIADKFTEKMIAGQKVWEISGNLNWAQGAMSGKLIKQMGSIPFLPEYPTYGHLESATLAKMKPLGYTWAMLPEYEVSHTDEVPLYRAWKDQIIFRMKEHGQLSFESWLQMKKDGTL